MRRSATPAPPRRRAHEARAALLLPLLLALALAGGPARVGAAPATTIIDLGTVPGYESFTPAAISAGGAVAGTIFVPSVTHAHAALWRAGALTDLGTLGGSDSYAYGINAAGAVVGESFTASGGLHAFVWRDGAMADLGTPPGTVASSARAINAAGQIVGFAIAGDKSFGSAVLWQDGAARDLGGLPGERFAAALSINDAGAIVGVCSATFQDAGRPCLWREGRVADLGAAPGSAGLDQHAADPLVINASGRVAGTLVTAAGHKHPFRTAPYTPLDPATDDLGGLAGATTQVANGINAAGQVVGQGNFGGRSHPFLYDGAALLDLNDRLPGGSGWVLETATAIDDAGQIVGFGQHDGKARAFLLAPAATPGLPDTGGGGMAGAPTPAPPAGLLLAAAVTGLAVVARRGRAARPRAV